MNTNVNTDSMYPSGWVTFAAWLMIIAGFFQMIAGFVALFRSNLYVVTESHLFVFDYTQWGWIHIIIGIALVLSAISLFAGQLWGRIVAIILAIISAIANFGFIWAYPIWSIIVITLDIAIIYSVVRYGGRRIAM